MTIISPDEYTLLMAASDYERNLQAVNIGKKYGLTSKIILTTIKLLSVRTRLKILIEQ